MTTIRDREWRRGLTCLVALALAICGCAGTAPREESGGARTAAASEADGPTEVGTAVGRALEWLRRHQEPDGTWSSDAFRSRCDAARGGTCTCVEGLHPADPAGVGFAGYDIGLTGLAVLAFVSAGVTPGDGDDPELRAVVDRALTALLAAQIRSNDPKLDGLIGGPSVETDEWIYNHAVATSALATALVVTRDRDRLAEPLRRAVEWSLRAQNPRVGWKYGYRTGTCDTSVTAWMVRGITEARTAQAAGLVSLDLAAIERSLADADHWFRAVTSSRDGRVGYHSPGDDGSWLFVLQEEDGLYPFRLGIPTMTAFALRSRLLSGTSRTDEAFRRGLAHVHESPPEWRPAEGRRQSTIHHLYWFGGAELNAMMTDEASRAWVTTAARVLLEHQRDDTCADGSWDPVGAWGTAGGRVYSTALAALTLGVEDRMRRIEESDRPR